MSHDLIALSRRIDTLLDDLEGRADPAVTEQVEDLVRAVMSLYAAGLRRMVELGDDTFVRTLADDELVGGLLTLHDLHPDDVTTRVQRALDRVRPYLGSHAGGVELVGVEDGVARLRLEGSCDGCPSSAITVTSAIEDAVLGAAPDVLTVEVEGMVEPEPRLLQIQPYVRPREGGAQGWTHLDPDVPPGAVSSIEVAGEMLVVARVGEDLVAYHGRCPGCDGDLGDATLDGDVLACASCPARYDVHLAGQPVSGTEAHLDPVPMLRDGTGWKASLLAPVGT